MKVLAISDLHGNLDGFDLSNIDLALFAGDVAPLEGLNFWAIFEQYRWMSTKFVEWCKQWPKCQIVFIPGNHDFFPDMRQKFSMPLDDIKFPGNAHMLIDDGIEIDGINIYGTPWVPIISHSWAFEAENDKLEERFSMIPEGFDILLSHTPPRHGKIDVSLQYGEKSKKFGSKELKNAIVTKQPRYAFCGHIHSGDHSMNEIGQTKVFNVSRLNESYDIAYEPLELEIDAR